MISWNTFWPIWKLTKKRLFRTSKMEPKQSVLILPLTAVSRMDVMRAIREIDALDDFLAQSAIRQPGTNVKLPKTSRVMDEVVEINKLNILVEADRKGLLKLMKQVYEEAPVLHISFSADPSPLFIQRLVSWLRVEVHPSVLLKIGLQPNIGAGCTIRTKNKYFDFSLRQNFKNQRQ